MITYQQFEGNSFEIQHLSQDQKNKQFLITSSKDQLVTVWDLNQLKQILQKKIESNIRSLALEYPLFAYSGTKGIISIENIVDSLLFKIELTRNNRDSFLLKFYKQYLISGCYDQKLSIWDYKQKSQVRVIELEPIQELKQNSLFQTQFVHINYSGLIKYIDIETNKIVNQFKINGVYEIIWWKKNNFQIVVNSGLKEKLYLLTQKNKILRRFIHSSLKISNPFIKSNHIFFRGSNNRLFKLNISDFQDTFVSDLLPLEVFGILEDEEILRFNNKGLYRLNFS